MRATFKKEDLSGHKYVKSTFRIFIGRFTSCL